MERPSWRRRPSKSWSLLSIIEYPTCRMGKCSCHFWLDLQMDRLEYQLWVQKNWPTTLSASILSIKVHTILLCLDCWFWWSILTIPRLKWVSRSDIICSFFLMSEIFQKSNCIRVKSGELEAYPPSLSLGGLQDSLFGGRDDDIVRPALAGGCGRGPMKRWGSQGYIWGRFYSMPFFGEWTVVCFFKSFTQFLRQIIFGWSSSRGTPHDDRCPWWTGWRLVMRLRWGDELWMTRHESCCAMVWWWIVLFYVSHDQWSRQTWTNTSIIYEPLAEALLYFCGSEAIVDPQILISLDIG